MAVIAPVTTNPLGLSNVRVETWETLTESDTAGPRIIPFKSDKTVSVTGTFGTATVVIQGSNDGTNWFTLTDAADAALSFTAAGLSEILENPLYIRPSASGGTGQDVDIIITAVGG